MHRKAHRAKIQVFGKERESAVSYTHRTDTAMLDNVLRKVKDMPGVKYIRVSRKDCVKVYEDGSDFAIGKGIALRDGKDVTLVASGIMVAKALAAADLLAKEGIDAAVLDMFTVQPLDTELLVEYARKTGAVVTAENHNKIGGLTSAVSEALAEKYPTILAVSYTHLKTVFRGHVTCQ